MSKIAIGLVKDLRRMTGAGVLDCNHALAATNSDIDKAVVWLKEKGKKTAAKIQSRVALEGAITYSGDFKGVSIAEFNSETDFVAKGEKFQTFMQSVTSKLNQSSETHHGKVDIPKFQQTKMENGITVLSAVTDFTSVVNEKIQIRRAYKMKMEENESGFISTYIHGGSEASGKLSGKIGACIKFLTTDPDNEDLKKVGYQIAVNVASYAPTLLNAEDVKDEDIPEGVSKKKFIEKAVLSEQPLILDESESKVKEVLQRYADKNLRIQDFIRYQVNEPLN